MLSSASVLAEKLCAARYVIDPVTLEVVYLAARMHKPTAVEGPPGWQNRVGLCSSRGGEHGCGAATVLRGELRKKRSLADSTRRCRSSFWKAKRTASTKNGAKIRNRLHTLDFFAEGPLLRALRYEHRPWAARLILTSSA